MKILISGGSGLLGRKLSHLLQSSGHEVAWLGRKQPANLPPRVTFFTWNPARLSMDQNAVTWAEAVINLAGASIGETRWTISGRKLILESRISSVNTLRIHFSQRKPLEAFVAISGAGFYGPGQCEFSEDAPAGTDFPAKVAAAWEDAYKKLEQECRPVHFCILRLAVVLSAGGGALPKILAPFRMGAGSVLGNGRQPFNWIHEDDAAEIMAAAIQWNGIVNASAPASDDNNSLTKAISSVLGSPLILPPIPAFALRALLGDRSSLVLEGNHSQTLRLQNLGYKFKYPALEAALRNLLKK